MTVTPPNSPQSPIGRDDFTGKVGASDPRSPRRLQDLGKGTLIERISSAHQHARSAHLFGDLKQKSGFSMKGRDVTFTPVSSTVSDETLGPILQTSRTPSPDSFQARRPEFHMGIALEITT